MIVCLRKTLMMAVLVPVLCVAVGQAAHAYEEIPIMNGGTLTGSVKLIGDVPKPRGYKLVMFPDSIYCGRISNGAGWRLLQPFHIEAQGAFRDVVVMLEEVAKGKPINFQTPVLKPSIAPSSRSSLWSGTSGRLKW